MLVGSHRLLDGDADEWERLIKYDQMLSLSASLTKKEKKAIGIIRQFIQDHDGDVYAGTSWGKDSTVIAHLLWRAKVNCRLVSVCIEPVQNPDNEKVRDVFLKNWQLPYSEIKIVSTERAKWPRGLRPANHEFVGDSPAVRGFKIAKDMFGAAHISGVRAEESSIRATTIAKNGEASAMTCRPIAYWSGEEIFAYLHKYNLPIHSAYACSFGGTINRKRLRVDFIDGQKGSGFGRSEWERSYYPDAFRKIRNFAKGYVENNSGNDAAK